MAGKCRKLHSNELHIPTRGPKIIRVKKSWIKKRVVYVPCSGGEGRRTRCFGRETLGKETTWKTWGRESIILKWILTNKMGRHELDWSGLNIGTSGGLFWTWQWTFSWLAEEMLAYEEWLCSMKLASVQDVRVFNAKSGSTHTLRNKQTNKYAVNRQCTGSVRQTHIYSSSNVRF